MDWTEIVVAVIAALGGFIGALNYGYAYNSIGVPAAACIQ